MSEPDRLDPEQIRSVLGRTTIGSEIVVLESTASTNDVIRQLVSSDRPEGLTVFAEHQTAGRGQRGNRWESAAGKGLYFSVLLNPQIPVENSPDLTTWAATAIAATIECNYSLSARIKAPNDVYIAERKIAGVLVEMLARAGAAHLAIVGVGLNVNQITRDFPAELHGKATSLAMAMGRSIDRNQLATALLREFDRTYKQEFGQD